MNPEEVVQELEARYYRRRRAALMSIAAVLAALAAWSFVLPYIWRTYPPLWMYIVVLATCAVLVVAASLVARLRPLPVPETELLRRQPRGVEAAAENLGP